MSRLGGRVVVKRRVSARRLRAREVPARIRYAELLVIKHIPERHSLPTRALLPNEAAVVPTKGVFADILELRRLPH
jgi:hypothetical protein